MEHEDSDNPNPDLWEHWQTQGKDTPEKGMQVQRPWGRARGEVGEKELDIEARKMAPSTIKDKRDRCKELASTPVAYRGNNRSLA